MSKSPVILFMILACMGAQGQSMRSQLRKAGRDYDKQRYEQAETKYRRALQIDSTDSRGQYNLGNTLYRQEKYAEAASHYQQSLADPSLKKSQRAHVLHNQGNSYLKSAQQDEQMQGLQQAVNCYQEALKLDPKNEDTRYNLAYARRLLMQQQQQQQQQGGQNQQQNQQQDQQNQQNQQNQNQQNQDNQQQNQQQQQNKGGQDQNQERNKQPQPNQQDRQKQDAERLLEAVKNNERQTLRDKQKAVAPVRSHKTDKDW